MPRYTDVRIPPKSLNFSEWFHAVVNAGMIAKQSPVPGCQILEENGADLWWQITEKFDPMIRSLGYRNKAWPALIPMSIFNKEKDHIAGFGPELAMIERLKGQDLDDPMCLRPTSETPIYDDMANVVQSAKDLPVLWNQWCDVWRVELRTKLLLRTFQFSWHEAHWAIARKEDALAHTLDALSKYKRFCREFLALPVIDGEKSKRERFAGAERTYTIEARMPDGKALQAGTSHLMGQGFAEAYDIKYTVGRNDFISPFTGSWGMSTRIMGAIVMTHSDDDGLVLPPKISPYQAVLLVVADKNTCDCEAFQKKLNDITLCLEQAQVRFMVDATEERLGRKHYHWEKQGVPVRIVYGRGEMREGTVSLIRRDNGERITISENDLLIRLPEVLNSIQEDMFKRAEDELHNNIFDIRTIEEFEELIENTDNAFASVGWCDDEDAEHLLKDRYGYTVRCYPLDGIMDYHTCFLTGRPALRQAIVAKTY